MVMFAALPAQAEDLEWTRLTGDEIRMSLTGRVLSYGANWQDFRSSGRTLYHSGAESWGYWRVQDDQYCSQWPPSNLWACYDIDQSGDMLRFVGLEGDKETGTYKD
jgi:hypothetical protein